jgi:hypothetical protein
MGVDWIPCRVEAGYTREEMHELVQLEAAHFRVSGSSHASTLDSRVRFSEADQAEIRRAYTDRGPLHRRLLFKLDGHRISVIVWEELFPIEWRIDAERTILPWELAEQFSAWQGYRDEVAQGMHQAYLRQLYVYVQIHALVTVEVANLTSVVRSSLTATASWARRTEVGVCRDELLAGDILALPHPPTWPGGGAEPDLLVVQRAFERVESAISTWNRAVQRGNKCVRPPKRPPGFDEWVANRLGDGWYSSFLVWVEPWKRGGYGLYRDCE